MPKEKQKTGRPLTPIDWPKVNRFLASQCTGEEVASFLDIDYDTLASACKREHSVSFSEYSELKREGGKASLRRAMWLKAMDPKNTAATIFLCKAYLGMKDYHP
ncbi:MAG: hypothetical protein V4440_03035, partial [Pseudomonadota bacterium]